MASTTEQRMAMENAIIARLDAGDDPDDVIGDAEDFIDQWKADSGQEE